MRSLFFLFLCLAPGLAAADQVFYPAKSGNAAAPVLTVYSSLDEPLAQPMIRGFQDANPDVAVEYEDMLTGTFTTGSSARRMPVKRRRTLPSPRRWTCR